MAEREPDFVVELDGTQYKLTELGWVNAITHVGVPTAIIGAIERAVEAQGHTEQLHHARRSRLRVPDGMRDVDFATLRLPHDGVRRTHCYTCKRPLSTETDGACARCGWLTCTCGACGCQYHGPPM